MNPAGETNRLGPSTCLKCGFRFHSDAPEPCRCPRCATLCSVFDEPSVEAPLPEECPLTSAERARWRTWFWVLLMLGLCMGLLAFPLSNAFNHLVPSELRPYADISGPFMVLGLPIVGALGAAFCLARSQVARRTTGELIVFTLLMGLLFLFTEAAIVFVGCSVVYRMIG